MKNLVLNFTPGPLEISPYTDESKSISVLDKYGVVVATFHQLDDGNEFPKYNAQLFYAAPLLLESLIGFVEQFWGNWEEKYRESFTAQYPNHHIVKAEKAIEQALTCTKEFYVQRQNSKDSDDAFIYRALITTYRFFANFSNNWPGRNTSDGQMLLSEMQNAIQCYKVSDSAGNVFRISIDGGAGWDTVRLTGEGGEKQIGLDDLKHYNPTK